MRSAVLLMVLGAASTWAIAARAVIPAADETAVSWTAISQPHTWSRSVRIQFSYPSCGVVADDAVSRIVVTRKHRTVVITVLMKKPAEDPSKACPQVARVYKRKVGLEGRLGARSLTDGRTGHVRVKRPRSR
jgi:hypothetical protein